MIRIATGAGWSMAGATRAKGHATLGSSALSSDDIAAMLDASHDATTWGRTIERLNGSFAAITSTADGALAAVDRVRTIPLFFARRGNTLGIADNAGALVTRPVDHGESDVLEFLLTGYTTGARTLGNGLLQLRAGEMLQASADGDEVSTRRYYTFRHRDFFSESPVALVDRLHGVHLDVFRRLVEGAGGRQLVVPLSGGYDSRLIAVMLKDRGATDVVCYSYGTARSWEADISRELARYLGFRWTYVPYSADAWQSWARESDFAAYLAFAGNLASVPHLQDWPAVRHLLAAGMIDRRAIVVPGHTGDFLTGGHIPPEVLTRAGAGSFDPVEASLSRHYALWPWPRRARGYRTEFARRVRDVIGAVAGSDPESNADAYERFDLEERQAKFICNSVRVYDFFGLEWRLPLFDHALMDFWTRVPVELRVQRRLYFAYVAKHQALPVRLPNTDRSATAMRAIALVNRLGLRAAGKALRRAWRRAHWAREWEDCSHAPLAWLGAVDRNSFRRTYTGNETLHSYMALRYLTDTVGERALAQLGIRDRA